MFFVSVFLIYVLGKADLGSHFHGNSLHFYFQSFPAAELSVRRGSFKTFTQCWAHRITEVGRNPRASLRSLRTTTRPWQVSSAEPAAVEFGGDAVEGETEIQVHQKEKRLKVQTQNELVCLGCRPLSDGVFMYVRFLKSLFRFEEWCGDSFEPLEPES